MRCLAPVALLRSNNRLKLRACVTRLTFSAAAAQDLLRVLRDIDADGEDYAAGKSFRDANASHRWQAGVGEIEPAGVRLALQT